MRDVETLKPFTRFLMTIGTLPSSYLVSMTYEEQLLWFCNFLQNNVIPTVNNNAEAVEELQNLYLQLKDYVDNYFENLDVQEEINNKLDDMAESGTLQEIIADYLNSKAVFGFDTVADMKEATNLIDGSYAETLGFNEINDGGSNLYKIRTVTTGDDVDEKNIIAITDTLIAVKIDTSTEINVKDFGATGDGTTDDTAAIQYCINKFVHRTIYIPDGKYLISSPLSIKSGNDYQVNIKMSENAILFSNTNIDSLIEIGKTYGGEWSRYEEGNKVHIEGGLLDCTNIKYGIYSNSDQKGSVFSNLNMINIDRYGIYCDRGTHSNMSSDARIANCNLNGTSSDSSNECTGIYLYSTDNTIDNIVMLRMKTAFEIIGGGNKISNIHVCTAWEDSISDNDFNNTIAFKYTNANYENLSNIYLDTYAIGFSLNGDYNLINISNVVQYYWYAGNTNIKTKFIDINTTISSNNRIYINNVNLNFPASNERNNTVIDLENAGGGYREYFNVYESLFINNIYYNIARIKAYDYINVMQIRKENAVSLISPWTITMVQNQYYPIAIVNRGFHEFNFRHDNTVYAKININVSSTISNSTITNTTIDGSTSTLSLTLLDIGLTDQDNRPLLILAEKSNTTNTSLNPVVDSVKQSYLSRFYSYRGFPGGSGLDLSNASVIATTDL